MEKVLSGELSKFLIIIGVGVLSLTALLARSISKVNESFKQYQKETACYLLVSLLFFAIGACFEWLFPKTVKHLTNFVIYQVYFLLLGILHLHLMHHCLKWSHAEKSFWYEVLFTVIIALFGCMAFLIIFHQFNREGFEVMMASGIWLFLIPLLFDQTVIRALDIPPRIIKYWFYPVNEPLVPPNQNELKNILIISFEFPKQVDDTFITSFRVRAPADMEFGKMFYFFINDYNERHPNGTIKYMSETCEPHGWIFYKKPKWYSIKTHYINTGSSVYLNGIRENDIIICSRSIN